MRLTVLTGAAAALAAVLAVPPSPVQAATPSPDGVSRQQALQRDLRLTAEQARVRQAHEATAITMERRIRATLGDRIGGAWYDPARERLSVGVLNTADATAVRDAGATPVPVRRSEQRLAATKAALDRAAHAAGTEIYGWYADVRANTVVVAAADRTAGERFVQAAGLSAAPSDGPSTGPSGGPSGGPSDGDDVRVTVDHAARPLGDVRGGDEIGIVLEGQGRVGVCSVGFSVDDGGFVTAGHCGKPGTRTQGWDGSDQGTFVSSTFPGADQAWVRVNDDWTPRPWINDYSGGNTVVTGTQEAPIGASVCRSGRTTQWRCGEITAKDVTVRFVEGFVQGLTRTTACAGGGDSGGPFVSDGEAQGVLSGGGGDCGGATAFTLFQPINPVLHEYNLTLTTTKRTGRIVGWQNRCIDVPSDRRVEGERPRLWTCDATGSQLWTFHRDGTVRNFNLCLDVAGTAVRLTRCGDALSQRFSLTTAGSLVNAGTDKCVEVVGAGHHGYRLRSATCDGGRRQEWRRG
ncbi:ricin-type beta-trefoil lectin domain protein [Spongiactinospora gelatinilytica]|uniref:ricin-type beta-trefoil lectin domain protein n=1 Tax=Spongiactinospora gelatinilytica TaxID=2666298 RepID=UPI0013148E69|nr:ricin-type beta-trefoil lectin domain protein [Spongiactinospora gelatinilytica]